MQSEECSWHEWRGKISEGYCRLTSDFVACWGEYVNCECPERREAEVKAEMDDWRAERGEK